MPTAHQRTAFTRQISSPGIHEQLTEFEKNIQSKPYHASTEIAQSTV